MSELHPVFGNALQTAKCPSCKEVMKPPTSICVMGHTLCYDCRLVTCCCPTCETEFIESKQTVLDQVISCIGTSPRPIKDLMEILKCPVCYRQLSPNCQTCLNGHAVCMSCFVLMSWCPICREGFICRPNVCLSAILGAIEMNVTCINNKYGCDFTGKYDEVWIHESLCPKRRYKCQAGDCNWEGEKDYIVDHIERAHKSLIVKRKKEYIKFTEGETKQKLIKTYNESFWIMYEFTKMGLSVGLQIIGSKSKAQKYRLNLKCIGKLRQADFSAPALPIFQNLSKHVKERKCLFIPRSSLDALGTLRKAVCNVERRDPTSREINHNMVVFSAFMVMGIVLWASRALLK